MKLLQQPLFVPGSVVLFLPEPFVDDNCGASAAGGVGWMIGFGDRAAPIVQGQEEDEPAMLLNQEGAASFTVFGYRFDYRGGATRLKVMVDVSWSGNLTNTGLFLVSMTKL